MRLRGRARLAALRFLLRNANHIKRCVENLGGRALLNPAEEIEGVLSGAVRAIRPCEPSEMTRGRHHMRVRVVDSSVIDGFHCTFRTAVSRRI